MNPKKRLRERRLVSAAFALVLSSLVVVALSASVSAAPPLNAAAFNEVGGLPTINATATTVTCPTCGIASPNVGDTLTALPGSWSQAPAPASYSYDWKRCEIDGTKCTTTGVTTTTYKVGTADMTHVLVVTVTAVNKDGSGTATSLPTGIINAATGPRATAIPTLSGLVIVGKSLSISNGVWSPAPTSYAIQWQRCAFEGATSTTSGVTETRISSAIGCVNVAGQTNSTYNVTAADIAHRVRAVVTATGAGGAASAISNTSSLALKPKPKKK